MRRSPTEFAYNIPILLLLGMFLLGACTEQQRARGLGGKAKFYVGPKEKLVTMTWKQEDLWFLTRPMREGEVPETYTFAESSSWGAFEGTIVVEER